MILNCTKTLNSICGWLKQSFQIPSWKQVTESRRKSNVQPHSFFHHSVHHNSAKFKSSTGIFFFLLLPFGFSPQAAAESVKQPQNQDAAQAAEPNKSASPSSQQAQGSTNNEPTKSDDGSANKDATEFLDLSDFPDLELLEFLGSWETESGEWIDPNLFLEEEMQQLLESAEQTEN